MGEVSDVLTEAQIAALWRAGFTIARRQVDPFEIDPKLIPRGMAYQWNDAGRENPGWREVPYARHPGVFAPWGAQGSVEIGNLYLCEQPAAEVQHKLERARTKAQQNVEDWIAKAGAEFSGAVRIGTQTRPGELDADTMRQVGEAVYANPETRTLETTVQIPRDMIPHVASIYRERDRLEAEVVRKDRTLAPGPIADKFYATVGADKGAPWWPTLRAILLPIAIDNVRANLKKEQTDE